MMLASRRRTAIPDPALKSDGCEYEFPHGINCQLARANGAGAERAGSGIVDDKRDEA